MSQVVVVVDRNDMIAGAATYGGSLTACTAATASSAIMSNESLILLVFSGFGATTALLGLAYTIWNGNRNYKLAREQNELHRLEMTRVQN